MVAFGLLLPLLSAQQLPELVPRVPLAAGQLAAPAIVHGEGSYPPVHGEASRRSLAPSGDPCSDNFGPALTDTELHGAGVGSPTGTPVENCCTACDALDTCTGFVVFGATCYLKGGALTQTTLADRTSYVHNSRVLSPPSPPPPSVCGFHYQPPLADTELMGGSDVGSPTGTPVENCCTACDALNTCTGFVVFGATCYLKGGTLTQHSLSGRSSYIHDARVASPPPPALPAPPSPCIQFFTGPLADTELSGQNVGSPTSTPADNCCTTCEALSSCTGFVIFGATCYLKGGALSQVSLADRISYIRIPPPPAVSPAPPPPPPSPLAPPPPPSVCGIYFQPALVDTELQGANIGGPESTPVDNCCSACDALAECTGFVVFGVCCAYAGTLKWPR